jgi:hypothetical protein
MPFASHEELLPSTGEILTDMLKETLHGVFDHWTEGWNGSLNIMVIIIHKLSIG